MLAPGTVKAMTSRSQSDETLYYITRATKKGSARIMCDGQELHTMTHDLRNIKVLGDGEYVMAHGLSVLVLGWRKPIPESETDYIWLEIPIANASTCVDARLIAKPSGGKKSSGKATGLRLAMGYRDGKIELYDDLSTLFGKDADIHLPSPRLLHWHRQSVSSLKFSKDGNYLISGGRETVLVLWQLDTGHKQFLPHLTSEVERIVVSPEGDRYALQMGDNSIMVLNTSELKPIANFAGLQMRCPPSHMLPSALSPPAATLHPQDPNMLLLSVPASQTKDHRDISARPFLQIFDIRTSRHVARQALTRNNVTDFNLGPESTPILPPDVKFLALSADGSWLATIDEWTPPRSDLDSLASGNDDLDFQGAMRREVYLKFWRWDEAQSLWTLTTRVDSPHPRAAGDGLGAGVVRALVSSPARNGFATLGEDGCVRLWRVRRKMRSGVVVKNEGGEEVVEWTCARTVRLEGDEDRADSPMQLIGLPKLQTACLAYAPDGSMLAAVHSTEDVSTLPVVYFIDTADGVMIPKLGLAATAITSVGFVNRYLVLVTRPAVYVWDLIDDTLKQKLEIPEQAQYGSWKAPSLTTNASDGTFAIATEDVGSGGATVRICSPTKATCLHSQTFSTNVETVLAGKGSRGYTVLFADATIQTLLPSSGRLSGLDSRTRFSKRITAPAAINADVDMVDVVNATSAQPKQLRSEEDDRPVVRPEQLAEIFDVGGVVMPPVRDMFRAVVGLFGRKPYVRPPVEVEA